MEPPALDAGGVQQVVQETRHRGRLRVDHGQPLGHLLEVRRGGAHAAQQELAVAPDRRQGTLEVVARRRDELVLEVVELRSAFTCLHVVGDVDREREDPVDRAPRVAQRLEDKVEVSLLQAPILYTSITAPVGPGRCLAADVGVPGAHRLNRILQRTMAGQDNLDHAGRVFSQAP